MLDRPRTIWSWAVYDWANSAFATTVIAGFFPVFFKAYWADPSDPVESTFWLGVANSGASILVAALAPVLGAIADRGSLKKGLLLLFATLGILMSGGLWLVAQGDWVLAVALYVIGTAGFMGANVFYDALIIGVASPKRRDYVSSLGFSLGYIGGGLLFAINVLMYLYPGRFGIPDAATAIRLSFVSVAVWWALFSIPLVLFVHDPPNPDAVPLRRAVREGVAELVATARSLEQLRVVGLFLLAYWLYIDGVDTVIRMAVDYGMSLGFDASSLIVALLVVQFVAFPATLGYAWVASKIGVKRAVQVAIVAYGLITVLAFFMTSAHHFYILAGCIGLFQGGIQALSRSLYGRIIPPSKAGAFFGLYNMLGKFAAVIGPLLMGLVAKLSGSTRYGVISIVLLFVVGGLLLRKVDIEEGERLAQEL